MVGGYGWTQVWRKLPKQLTGRHYSSEPEYTAPMTPDCHCGITVWTLAGEEERVAVSGVDKQTDIKIVTPTIQ